MRPHEQWQEDAVIYQELLTQMLHFLKPLIAAVNGPAVAGGEGLNAFLEKREPKWQ